MADRVELGYSVKVQGARELKELADQQRAVRESTAQENQVLEQNEEMLKRAAAAADLYAKKQETARRSSFKKGETYDPELIEGERLKSLGALRRSLDSEIEKSQLRQLSAEQRINAERLKGLDAIRQVGGGQDLVSKVNQLAQSRNQALANAEYAAALKAGEARAKQLAQNEFALSTRQVRSIATSPGSGLTSVADEAAEAFGGTATAVLAVGAALVTAAAAGTKLVQESAEWAQNTQNTALRLGLSADQMVKLGAAARVAGVNITALEQAGRVLTQALEDPTGSGKKVYGELQKIGVKPQNLFDENGQVKELGPIITDVLDKLAQIPNSTERIAAATRILSRSGKELIPVIADYGRLKEAVEQLRLENEGALVSSLSRDAEEFNKLGVAFDDLIHKLGAKIAPIVIPVVTTLTDLASNAGAGTGAAVLASLASLNPAAFGALALKLGLNAGGAGKPGGLSSLGIPGGLNTSLLPDVVDQQGFDAAERFKRQFANTDEGLAQRKSALETQIRTLSGTLSLPTLSTEARASQQKELNSNQAELRNVEERIKNLHRAENEYDKLKQELQGYQKQADQFDLSGVEKITAKYKEFTDEVKANIKSVKQRNELLAGASEAERKELEADARKQNVAHIKEELSVSQALVNVQGKPGDDLHQIQARYQATVANVNQQKAAGAPADQVEDQLRKAKDERDRTLLDFYGKQLQQTREHTAQLAEVGISSRQALFERQANFNPFGVFNEAQEEQRARNISASRQAGILERQQAQIPVVGAGAARATAQEEAAKEDARLQEQILEIRQRGEQKILQLRLEQLKTTTSQQLGLLKVTGNPEDQAANIERNSNLKLGALREELALTGDIDAYKKAADQEEYERTLQLLELQKQEAEKFKSTITEAALALQNGGRQGLAKFGEGVGKKIEATIIGNIAEAGFEFVRPLLPSIGGQHEKDANGNDVLDAHGNPKLTLLGTLLKGTPFAEKTDPQKIATVQNTEETKLNTTALNALNKSIEEQRQRASSGSTGNPAVDGVITAIAAKESSACSCSGGSKGLSLGGLNSGTVQSAIRSGQGLFKLAGATLGFFNTPAVSSSISYGGTSDYESELPLPGGYNPALSPFLSVDNTGAPDLSDLGVPGGYNPSLNPDVDIDDDTLAGLGIPGGYNPALNPNVSSSALSSIGATAAAAGAIAGGVLGVQAGINQGGAKGTVGAIGSGLGSAAGIAALVPGGQVVAGALALGAAVSGLISSFLPNNRQQRSLDLERELESAKYVAPNSINVTENTQGAELVANAKGGYTTLSGAPLVQLYNQILGIDPTKPTHLLSATNQQLSTGLQALPSTNLNPVTGLSTSPASSTAAPATPVNVTVQTMDSKSFTDNAGNIANAVSVAMRQGHRINSDIISRVRPQ